MSQEKDKNVVIRLEVLVPQGSTATASCPSQTTPYVTGRSSYGNDPGIQEPPRPQGITYRPTPAREGKYICAYGIDAFEDLGNGQKREARHVFAWVYEGPDATIGDVPPPGSTWTRALSDPVGEWKIDSIEIPTVDVHTLAVWADYLGTETYSKNQVNFEAVHATQTYCQTYPDPSPPTAAQRAVAASTAPIRWKFTITGVASLECANCEVLNKTWIIELDNSQPHKQRWLCTMPQSFAGPEHHAYWRLQFCPSSGNYFLDCVQHPDVALGTWISYRCHEANWKRNGQNQMTLHNNTNYCKMPQTITLSPA